MKRFTEPQKRIVQQIQALHRTHAPLNISAVKRHQPTLLRQVMTLKHFAGWRQALEAAGLSYAKIRIELLDHCICALCGEKMFVLSSHLAAKHGMSKAQYCRKFPDESTMSEQMRAEKTESLRQPPHWEPVWSREYMIDYLIYKHQRGEDLAPWSIYQNEPAVHGNIKKYFGSYRAAIEAAGIDYRQIRVIDLTERWTPAKVLERIRKLHQKRPLTSTGDIRRRDSRLYDRCHRYFGGCVPAVEAAGIPYVRLTARRSRQWTKQTVLHTIQVLGNSGSSLRKAALSTQLDGQTEILLATADQYFGSWDDALRAAGIVPKNNGHASKNNGHASKNNGHASKNNGHASKSNGHVAKSKRRVRAWT
jgi:hypothetical protein